MSPPLVPAESKSSPGYCSKSAAGRLISDGVPDLHEMHRTGKSFVGKAFRCYRCSVK